MPVVELVPAVSEAVRPVIRVQVDWGGESVGELEMISERDHLMVLTVVVYRPAGLVELGDVAGAMFGQQVTEKLLAAAVEVASSRGAVLSIAVPRENSYAGFLAVNGFLPLAGEVWRRESV